MAVILGAIADDFTGATDLANTLVKEGMRTVQTIGVPAGDIDFGDAEAIVIALKSRTAPVRDAVESSLEALDWLSARGASQFFFKYCSTFDSTPEGNIGPVADALMEALGTDFALVCPAFPDNGRIVRDGLLYVHGELLAESPMKDHPLTPMWGSNLVELMSVQSKHDVGLIDRSVIAKGSDDTAKRFEALAQQGFGYGVVDTVCNADLRTIGKAAARQKLITGGSGAAIGLPANYRDAGLLGAPVAASFPKYGGRSAVLAGSCSVATRGQIAFVSGDWPSHRVDVDRIADGKPVAAELLDWVGRQDEALPVLVYASTGPEEMAEIHARYGAAAAGEMVELVMGQVAQGLIERGIKRLVVAGGETSGAVVSALDVKALRIGPEIDPGVPWTETVGSPHIALALKSGNFGGEDFFQNALRLTA